MNILFSEQDKKNITEAIATAELNTNGEIVVHHAKQSSDYLEGSLLLGTCMACLTLLLAITISILEPSSYSHYHLYFAGVAGAIGYVFGRFIPSLRLLFYNQSTISTQVALAASSTFLRKEIFKTKDRTGVLIYISELEKQVLILGDSSINKVIKEEGWSEMVATIINGIKNKAAADGVISAIALVGDKLNASGFQILPNDENELPNTFSENDH